MENAPEATGGDRRRFLKLLALVGMSSAIAGRTLPIADAAPAVTAPPPKPAVPPDTTAQGKPEISEDARDLAEIVRRRYGKHLDPNQLERVTEELDSRLQSGQRLRDVKLGNHEEPDFAFRA
jgi:hypothetical protein